MRSSVILKRVSIATFLYFGFKDDVGIINVGNAVSNYYFFIVHKLMLFLTITTLF